MIGLDRDPAQYTLSALYLIHHTTPDVASYSRRTGAGLGGSINEANQGDFFIRLKPKGRRRIEAGSPVTGAVVKAGHPGGRASPYGRAGGGASRLPSLLDEERFPRARGAALPDARQPGDPLRLPRGMPVLRAPPHRRRRLAPLRRLTPVPLLDEGAGGAEAPGHLQSGFGIVWFGP